MNACQPDVVWRSLKVSLVVGTLLTLINHADVLWLNGGLAGLEGKIMLKILLTYCVPFGVSTYASVSTQMINDKES